MKTGVRRLRLLSACLIACGSPAEQASVHTEGPAPPVSTNEVAQAEPAAMVGDIAAEPAPSEHDEVRFGYFSSVNSAFDSPEGVPAGAYWVRGRPRHVAVFFHGFSLCIRRLVEPGRVSCASDHDLETGEGWNLTSQIRSALPQNWLFVMPQLAFVARDPSPGRFGEGPVDGSLDGSANEPSAEQTSRSEVHVESHFRAYLNDLGVVLGEPVPNPEVLVAHSGGYLALQTLLADSNLGTQVRHVVFYDALYANVASVVRWYRHNSAARVTSIVTGRGTPTRLSAILSRHIPVSVITTTSTHRNIPNNHLTDLWRD